MVEVRIQSYEDRWLEEGHYLGLEWKQGMWIVQIRGRHRSAIEGYGFGNELGAANLSTPVAAGTPLFGLPARLAAITATVVPNPVTDDRGRYLLRPAEAEKTSVIHHIFWGVSPGEGEYYIDYPSRIALGSLLANRPVGGIGPGWLQYGKIGVWRGDDTPIENPAPTAEIFTVGDGPWPEYWVNNPTQNVIVPLLGFKVMAYSYIHVRNTTLLRDFLTPGGRRIRTCTIGPVPSNVDAPNWLQDTYGAEFQLTKGLLELNR